MRAVIVVALLGACHRDPPIEAHRDPVATAPSSRERERAVTLPKHRVQGDIEARITLASTDVVVGEPIVAELTLRPLKSDLTIFIGGDMRNTANYPMRFGVRALDASGKVVCDLVEKPALMSFGGPGSDRVLAKGETLTERLVLNPACPALATPGTYRLTIHRRVTHMGMVIKKPTPTSCDVVPIHEDPLPPGIDPACAKMLSDAPSVTSELEIVVRPFDQTAVRKAILARLAVKDEILRHRVEAFVCRFLTCGCPKTAPVAEADLIAAVGATPQGAFPAACP